MNFKQILHRCLLLIIIITDNIALDTTDIIIVVLSQKNAYHTLLAEKSKGDIQNQAKNMGVKAPIVHLSHIDFPMVGDWTVLPLIPILQSIYSSNSSWIVFAEDSTEIRLAKLLPTLNKYNPAETIFVGYALHDADATIIHHFAFFDDPKAFKYPNVATGFAMTTKLINHIGDRLRKSAPNSDFSIDRSHELAKYIWNDGKGPSLIHDASFCVVDGDECCTTPTPFKNCDKPVDIEALYFAVKTCSKFHEDRIPVVKGTWATKAKKITYFSDLEDTDIPTVNLGIPNTESGHCAKTMAILKYAAKLLEQDDKIRWIILSDDDTLLSIPRLQRFLSCYDFTQATAIGERYGYNVLSSEGYNYITGGGGIVMSRRLVQLLNVEGICECPQLSTPDDMFLGICMDAVGGEIIHSPFFHQARPVDYAKDYLKSQLLISFHKHWMIDPFYVYKNWLLESDEVENNLGHIEL